MDTGEIRCCRYPGQSSRSRGKKVPVISAAPDRLFTHGHSNRENGSMAPETTDCRPYSIAGLRKTCGLATLFEVVGNTRLHHQLPDLINDIMKTMTSRFLALACSMLGLFAMTHSARAQEDAKHPAKPLLWKVEGKGLTQPSYLFGTIHISKGPAVTLHPAAQNAFDASSHFYAEVPMDPAGQMAIMPLMMRKDGKTLDEAIGEDLAAGLNAELKLINPALDSKPFQTMSTWFAAVLPQVLPHQLEGGKPLDMKLWEQATSQGKKTAGMEKPEAQILAFTELTEEQQVTFLAETLKFMKKERAEGKDTIQKMTQDLIDAYVSGEPLQVTAEINRAMREMAEGEHKELGEKLMKRLLTDRDKTMADFIVTSLKKQPEAIHFFAAGAAHFCTEISIVSHLQDAGYTVTRIEK